MIIGDDQSLTFYHSINIFHVYCAALVMYRYLREKYHRAIRDSYWELANLPRHQPSLILESIRWNTDASRHKHLPFCSLAFW